MMGSKVYVYDGPDTLLAPDADAVAMYYGVPRQFVETGLRYGSEICLGVTVDYYDGDAGVECSPEFAVMKEFLETHKLLRQGKPRSPKRDECRVCCNCVNYLSVLLPDGHVSGRCRAEPGKDGIIGMPVQRWGTCGLFRRHLAKDV